MSKSHARLAYPLGNFPGRSPFARERALENFGDPFFLFFPRNPLKLHEMAKEKLANSKEKFADSKEKFDGSQKILGNKKKKFGGVGDFERAPASPHERCVTRLGQRPRLQARLAALRIVHASGPAGGRSGNR